MLLLLLSAAAVFSSAAVATTNLTNVAPAITSIALAPDEDTGTPGVQITPGLKNVTANVTVSDANGYEDLNTTPGIAECRWVNSTNSSFSSSNVTWLACAGVACNASCNITCDFSLGTYGINVTVRDALNAVASNVSYFSATTPTPTPSPASSSTYYPSSGSSTPAPTPAATPRPPTRVIETITCCPIATKLTQKFIEKVVVENATYEMSITRDFSVKNDSAAASGYVSTFTLTIKNTARIPLKDLEIKEEIPAEVATKKEQLHFAIPPTRFEEGSIIAVWKIDRLEANSSVQFSYWVDKNLSLKVMDLYAAPAILSIEMPPTPTLGPAPSPAPAAELGLTPLTPTGLTLGAYPLELVSAALSYSYVAVVHIARKRRLIKTPRKK